jgi:restriction endonuclease Mrr
VLRQTKRQMVLIDGAELAGLMIEHNVGVTPYKTSTLKRSDADYREEWGHCNRREVAQRY